MSGGVLDRLPPVAEATLSSAGGLGALVATAQPVVLRGLVSDWLAVAAGRNSPAALNAYLKPLDRGLLAPVMEAPAASEGRFGYAPGLQEFGFAKRQRPLGETLDRIERGIGREGAPVVAIQMLPLDTNLPDFGAQNPMPLLPGVAPLLWLGGPVRTQIHNDRDHNLACVIAGRRRFVLFPPTEVANLYIGPLDRPPPLSLVDPEHPDLKRFPRFADALARAQVAELGPGDALFMPRHCWHHVTSRDPYNAMVNYWWGTRPRGLDDPHSVFLAALLSLKDLAPADRDYWRAMIDCYVFGDGAAHLPPEVRGMLGRMPATRRAALRQQLKSIALQS